jgi:hypothetical protein
MTAIIANLFFESTGNTRFEFRGGSVNGFMISVLGATANLIINSTGYDFKNANVVGNSSGFYLNGILGMTGPAIGEYVLTSNVTPANCIAADGVTQYLYATYPLIDFRSNPYLDVAAASVGVSWTLRTPAAGPTTFTCATYGANLFVIGSGTANVQTSNDGITWTNQITANTANALAFGNAVYVGVGPSGAVQSSTNATSWTNRTTANTNNMMGVAYGNGIFVAVGVGGAIQTSPDGTSWTNRTTANTNQMNNTIYGNGVYVAVGVGGAIQSSPNATSWTNRTTANTNQMFDVTYGNGVYVAVGAGGAIQSSTDGTAWTNRTTANTNDMYCVAYYGGTFIACGNSDAIQTSQDGSAWTNQTTALSTNSSNVVYDVAVGGGLAVGVSSSGNAQSSNLTTYNPLTTFIVPPLPLWTANTYVRYQ